MSTDLPGLQPVRLAGPTMGTSWSADLGLPPGTDRAALERALAEAVAEVDAQMSTWKPESDLMRLNAAPPGTWVPLPAELMQVLARGLEIGRLSGGAFDIALGDLVRAWGFNAQPPDEAAIRAALGSARPPAHALLELDLPGLRARKHAPLALDLSGIAKGYGVDRMMQVCEEFAVPSALVALDGELRARGVQPDGRPWSVVIEAPEHGSPRPHSLLELHDNAVATSGDYRQWVRIGAARLSHTMDRLKGGPVQPGIASVTVVAPDCMTADALATAILALEAGAGGGPEDAPGADPGADAPAGTGAGEAFARRHGVDCLILRRGAGGLEERPVGPLFEG